MSGEPNGDAFLEACLELYSVLSLELSWSHQGLTYISPSHLSGNPFKLRSSMLAGIGGGEAKSVLLEAGLIWHASFNFRLDCHEDSQR